MPTINQLAPATAASDTDEFVVSQSGIARSITRAQVLAGVQAQLSVASGTLLGGPATGIGSPQQVSIGANLSLVSGTLNALASSYVVSSLPAGNVPATSDSVPIGQAGTNVAVTYAQFLNGLSAVAGINGSQLLVTATGSTAQQRLADFAANTLPKAGGTLTGPLNLAGDPSVALQAATKEYVDTRLFRSGDTLTGPLNLVGNPSAALQAAPKQYVDSQLATALPLTGGTLTGAVSLPGNPSGALQIVPKQYVDAQVATTLPLSGGTLTGSLSLAGSPSSALQATPKQYVDAQVATTLPLSGGTLSGALTLASAPTSSLQAATKSYVDLRVLKSGDMMTGPLTLTQSYTGSAAPGLLAAGRAQSVVGDAPVTSSAMTLAFAGGAGSSNTNTLLTTNIGSSLDSKGNAVDGPGTEVYSLVSYLNSTALRPLGVSPVAAQHVSIQSAPTRNLPPGGVPAGRQMAELWALWLPTVDNTNLPSSIANAITGNEIDLIANNVDDANGRFGMQLVLTEAKAVSLGGYPLEWAYGITTTTSATSQFKWMANLQGNYSIAVIDTRNAFPNGTAGPPPKLITGLTSPATTIHVSNVLPFTSAGVYGQPVSTTNTTPIKIGSNTYTQTGYTFDGPGLQSGIVTVSTAVSIADGTIGNLVTNTSRTIWLATGQQIAFDYGGSISVFYDGTISALHVTSALTADGGLIIDHTSGTSLFWDSTALGTSGGAHLQGNLLVTGTIYTWSNLTVGGSTYLAGVVNLGGPVSVSSTSTFQGAVSMNGGLTVAAGPLVAKGGASVTGGLSVGGGTIGLPTYTVATLPPASVGALAYASNGRKTGEAAGAGTGVLAIGGVSGQWTSAMSGTAILT